MIHKIDKSLSCCVAIGFFVSVLLAGIIGVTTSTLLQSYPLLLMGVVCVLAGLLTRKNYREVGLTHILVIGLATVYYTFRAIFSPSQDLGIGDMFLIFSAVSVYGIVNFIKDPKLAKFSVVAIVILFVANVLNYFPAFATFRDELIPFARGSETSGMFNHRNFCSNLVMMGTLVLIAFSLLPANGNVESKWKFYSFKILAALVGIIGVCSLFFIGARGALLGLATGLFIFFFCLLITKKRKASKIFLCVGVVSILSIFLFIGKIEFLVKRGIFDDRMQYFSMAVDQVQDSILLGSGSMSYSYKYYENWGDFGTHHLDHTWVHNEFLQVLTDYGVVGLIILMIVLLWVSYIAFRNINGAASEGQKDVKVIVALSVMGGFLANCLVSFPAHSYVNIMIVAMVVAWIVPKKKEGHVSSKATLCLTRVSFILMGMFMIYLSIPRLKAAKVYSKYSIYTDTIDWNPYENNDGRWLSALEEVNKVSPNYISYSRLADLYMIKAETSLEKEFYAKQSLECSEQALQRHPYFAQAHLTKAKSLWYLGEFKLADESFEYLAEFTKHRRRYYRASIAWLSCLVDAGNYYLAIEDFTNSKRYFRKALKVLSMDDPSDKYSFSRVFSNNMQTRIVAGYSQALLANGEHAELDQLMDDIYGSKGRYSSMNNEILWLIQGRMFAQYGYSLYMRRKPSLAYKYFIWAEQNFSQAQRRWKTEFSRSDLDTIEKMKSVVKILKEGRVQPAE